MDILINYFEAHRRYAFIHIYIGKEAYLLIIFVLFVAECLLFSYFLTCITANVVECLE